MRTFSILTLVCACLFATPSVEADTFGPDDEAPSLLSYGFKGLGTGALIGLSGGYLAARDGDWERSNWKPIGYGVGIGALAGVGFGLALGAVDLGADRPGVGGIVLRDMLYGTGLGAVAGVLAGGISAGVQDEAEHVAFGAALGALSGAGFGLLVGLIEGPRIVRSHRHQVRKYTPSMTAARDAGDRTVWMLGASGRF